MDSRVRTLRRYFLVNICANPFFKKFVPVKSGGRSDVILPLSLVRLEFELQPFLMSIIIQGRIMKLFS